MEKAPPACSGPCAPCHGSVQAAATPNEMAKLPQKNNNSSISDSVPLIACTATKLMLNVSRLSSRPTAERVARATVPAVFIGSPSLSVRRVSTLRA